MTAVGLALLVIGLFGSSMLSEMDPWGLRPTRWSRVWVAAFLMGAALTLCGVCVWLWRVLP